MVEHPLDPRDVDRLRARAARGTPRGAADVWSAAADAPYASTAAPSGRLRAVVAAAAALAVIGAGVTAFSLRGDDGPTPTSAPPSTAATVDWCRTLATPLTGAGQERASDADGALSAFDRAVWPWAGPGRSLRYPTAAETGAIPSTVADWPATARRIVDDAPAATRADAQAVVTFTRTLETQDPAAAVPPGPSLDDTLPAVVRFTNAVADECGSATPTVTRGLYCPGRVDLDHHSDDRPVIKAWYARLGRALARLC